MSDKKDFLEAFTSFLEKHFEGSTQEPEHTEEFTPVTKAVNEEQRKALFVALAPEVEDLHGDIYSAEEIEKACHNYNVHCGKANLFHETEIADAFPVESYINPVEFSLEDGRVVQKGSWLQLWHFEETELGEALWKSVKEGNINGISIGCLATVEELENDGTE
ncbi:MAG: hypothetical protein GWO20_13115 [Candidatus Korarchaeota archaeon]|nr:hypothetical protein [Candidatus Korarchaeota archaeon]